MSDMIKDIADNPIPKQFVERAKTIGLDRVTIHFSGGSDEGFINVSYSYAGYQCIPDIDKNAARLCDDIERWAWKKFYYNGAGDGSDYGDDIEYNIKEGTVSTSSWWTAREYGRSFEMEMECAEGPDDE